MKKLFLLLIILLVTGYGYASASTLRVGLASDARSMDPFFHNETATNSLLNNMFDGLVRFDENLNVHPALAVSWSLEGDNIWTFNLRQGVKFHNGSPFTADDVIFSIQRMKTWEKSSFKAQVSQVDSVEKIDDHTVRITTNGPAPTLLRKLTYAKIMDSQFAADKSDEFLGLNPVGTGPYQFVAWRKGESVRMAVNPLDWRPAPVYSEVEFKILTNGATRVAAILSGAIDLVDKVPVTDVPRIQDNKNLQFFMYPGLRLIYLQLDQGREETPYIAGKNPFLDERVRKAFFLGIDADAIVKYVMQGHAKVADQYSPEFVFGHDSSIIRPAFDPEQAKKLLAEAGYPNGFDVVLDAPNDRYVNDAQIAQAVASSLARIGVRVKVNAIPKSAFFPKTDKLDSSFFLIGWASNDGDASSHLNGITHSYDPDKGYGRFNRSRYSNPAVDTLIQQAQVEMDQEKRLKMLQEAQQISLLEDFSAIPVHYEVDLYATTKKVIFVPRADTNIYVYDIK